MCGLTLEYFNGLLMKTQLFSASLKYDFLPASLNFIMALRRFAEEFDKDRSWGLSVSADLFYVLDSKPTKGCIFGFV